MTQEALRGVIVRDDGCFVVKRDAHYPEAEAPCYLLRAEPFGHAADGSACLGFIGRADDERWLVQAFGPEDPATGECVRVIGAFSVRTLALDHLWAARHQVDALLKSAVAP